MQSPVKLRLDKPYDVFRTKNGGALLIAQDRSEAFRSRTGDVYSRLHIAEVHYQTLELRDPSASGRHDRVVLSDEEARFRRLHFTRSNERVTDIDVYPSRSEWVVTFSLRASDGIRYLIETDRFGGGRNGFRLHEQTADGAPLREIPLHSAHAWGLPLRHTLRTADGGELHLPAHHEYQAPFWSAGGVKGRPLVYEDPAGMSISHEGDVATL